MRFKIKIEKKWLRPCTVCGSIVRVDDLFCESCLLEFLKSKNASWPCCNHHFLFEHIYLLKWLKDSNFLNSFVRVLKGVESKTLLFQFLSSEFYGKNSRLGNYKKIIWVPAPAKIFRNQDHAYQLAVGLQEIFGGEIHNVLKRLKKQKEQKKLGLNERGQIKFKLEAGYQIDPQANYLFVDDILTSGATALACYNSLKKPLRFGVYTIFWRPK